MHHKQPDQTLQSLRRLLVESPYGTQESVCSALNRLGHDVTQSKVSRLLRKIGAIKVKSETGELIYQLPGDLTPPPMVSQLSDLITEITHNESLIVIHTSPGSAMLIARLLDNNPQYGILGTVAGDDTIFVAPQSTQDIQKTLQAVKDLLSL